MQIRYTVHDLEVKTLIANIQGRLKYARRAMRECGLVGLRSIARTFKVGGRPRRWVPSKRAKNTPGGKTLIKSGRLRSSITTEVTNKSVAWGTNVKYAAAHQFGLAECQNVRAHWRTIRQAFGKPIAARSVRVAAHRRAQEIPRRTFLLMQDADVKIYKRIILSHVVNG